MQGTQIYRKELSRRLLFGAIGVVAVYLLFVRPVNAVKPIDENEQKSNGQSIVEEPVVKPISAQELYFICTRSNEYLLLVDARTEQEYQAGHITSSLSLKAFEERDPDNLPKIRVFFYSNENKRSQEVAAMYASRGVNAYYVEGGLYAWKPIQGLLPIIRDDQE
ncbi:hypothetical protein JH06_0952 [Blastocystis sp. subtype 4]|uniref:hypothetical protein n=1 Tax=Blastocystis sp. subtype 4 TaxID=944170 RepID=UPI0007113659|nr:hypothetical protein JH06_0952 [Blastocystis sp. subtype 4]KNB45398.1 hypothetical protein JH06_0952 [Blastocystis sp. subtype 4]|eukprot:XP_014528841.1 hypothetical protein JH06_0952 [Blastocystis sp. subtype 4]